MASRCIEPARRPVDAELTAVPSKSVTHRALVAAAIAKGTSELRSPLDADDTRATREGLRSMGVRIEDRGDVWTVAGAAGAIRGGGSIDAGASGTTARFLTALAAIGSEPSTIDGGARLRQRPMQELVGALRAAGASVSSRDGGRLPIRAGGVPVPGGAVEVAAGRSSQFASALLLAAPAFLDGLRLDVPPPRVSFPYVSLTIEILRCFGARVDRESEGRFLVPRQTLTAASIEIEGDHSSASYLLAATAIVGGRLRLEGLRADSAQPDARFLRDLAALGCTVARGDGPAVTLEASGEIPSFAWNLSDAPDLAPTAAVLALFAGGACRLSGLDHLRFKESDRMDALASNLERCGARVEVAGGTLTIETPGRGALTGATIRVASDHRTAMAFAVAGLAIPGVRLDEPEAVAKSYPGFWDDLARLTGIRTGS